MYPVNQKYTEVLRNRYKICVYTDVVCHFRKTTTNSNKTTILQKKEYLLTYRIRLALFIVLKTTNFENKNLV